MNDGSKRLSDIFETSAFNIYCCICGIRVKNVKKWIDADVSFKSLPKRLRELLVSCEPRALAEISAKKKFPTLSEEEKKKLNSILEEYLNYLSNNSDLSKLEELKYDSLSFEEKSLCWLCNKEKK
jgi:hypothetical protein